MSNPLFIMAVLCMNIVVSEWLVRHTFLRHVGTALVIILLTAIVANLGVIPSASNAPPLYGSIFSYLAPIGIFLLLLEVNLRHLKQAGLPMLTMFLIGSAGTVAGVVLGLQLVDAPETIGELFPAIGGMFVATYTGGSINFNAVALHFKVTEHGSLYTGALAVDNIMTSVWMIATILLPKLLQAIRPRDAAHAVRPPVGDAERHEQDRESIDPTSLATVLGLGALALWLSNLAGDQVAARGIALPPILILTTLALVLAQFRRFNRLRGSRVVGMYSIYLFLAVIGAHAEIATLYEIGKLGWVLFLFVTTLVATHGVTTFGLGALLRQDWNVIAIASQANIGGSTSALALAKSLNRVDLFLPAILVGSLGNGLGTYLGFVAAAWLSA